MAYENLILSDKGSTRTITINRPKVLNALNKKVLFELKQAVSDIEQNKNIRAVVITGAGEKSFVAGADISEMKNCSSIEAENFSHIGQMVFDSLENLKCPVIACVNGYALGGGLELALACDFIYSSENASFGLVETKLGLIPGFGGIARLCRRVGSAYAKEMIFSASHVTAQEALRVGLVNKVVDDGNVVDSCLSLAEKMSERGPLALGVCKKLLRQAENINKDAMDHLERTSFGLIFSSKDSKEGINAFLDKRPAVFEGV